jgi:1,4-dihydroxy-2-naphthoate polyprenyltransferase
MFSLDDDPAVLPYNGIMNHLSTINKMWAFVKLTRPVFLLGGVFLYGLGVAVAAQFGMPIDLWKYALGQAMVTLIQLTAQYANECQDVECDLLNSVNRTWFSGGSGVLPTRSISIHTARQAMQFSALAGLLAIVLVAVQVPLAGMIGLLGLLGAWFYSTPPISLMSTGWGELVASLVVALLVPLAGFTLHTGDIDPQLLAICAQLVLVHMAMLIAFELPDWKADAAAGKRTLRVRLGLRRIIYLHTALLLAAFMSLFLLHLNGIAAARFVWLALPLAVLQGIQVTGGYFSPPKTYRWITLGSVALFVWTVTLWLIGILWE